MAIELIYLQEDGADGYSMHRLDIEHLYDGQRMIRVGPWEKDHQWTAKALSNPINMSLEDHGNGVRIMTAPSDTRGAATLDLDYAQVIDLMMLLDAYNKDSYYVTSFKRFKEAT